MTMLPLDLSSVDEYLRLLLRLLPDGYSDDDTGPRVQELEAYAQALAEVLETVRSQPGVRLAIPRVLVNGLVSTSAASSAVHLRGVDPELEARLTDPAEDLVRGSFLAGDRSDPIVLGARLVEKLELEMGDRVVLTASDPGGELTRALFHLSGVVETGTREVDEMMAYTSIEAAREAVGMEGMLTQVGAVAAEATSRPEAAPSSSPTGTIM